MKLLKDTVYTLRLANGDEWVTQIEREDDDHYFVKKPAAVMMTQAGPELLAAMFTADNDREVTINKTHVVASVVTKAAIAQSYITATTGIVAPQKNIILG